MPFRALSNSLGQRSSALSLRHSSRGVHQPVFDRYGAIRTFFKQQRVLETPAKALSRRAYNSTLSLRDEVGRVGTSWALASQADRYQLTRLFHSCPRRGDDRRKGGSPVGNSQKHHLAENIPKPVQGNPQNAKEKPEVAGTKTDTPPPPPPHNYENYPESLRRLAMSLPHLHRPTRDDFLNVASGFWQRARIRFKWFTIKSFRKFNADDISAFVTWFLTAQFLWIFVGT